MTYNNIIDMQYNSKSGAWQVPVGGLAGRLNSANDKLHSFAESCVQKGITSEKAIRSAGKKAGFTLIELLVVIGIIGSLAGMILPALSRAKEQGRRAVCVSNLRQIGLGMEMYANDNEGIFPRGSGAEGDEPMIRIRGPPGALIGAGRLVPYLGNNPKIFACPSASKYKENYVMQQWNSTGNVDSAYLYDGWYVAKSNKDKMISKKVKLLDANITAGGDANISHGYQHVNMLYGDGHVKWVSPSDYPGLLAYTTGTSAVKAVFDAANSLEP